MSRFFITDDNIYSDSIIISGEDFNHIKNVLRYKTGDSLILCDGNGRDYYVYIEFIGDKEIKTKIIDVSENQTEASVNVTLFQGMAKGEKMDFIIQKSVELGVSRIVPVITERTVVKLENSRDKEKKRIRWQRIALEAAKQCNRGVIPEVGLLVDFTVASDLMHKFNLALIPYEKEEKLALKTVLLEFKNKYSNLDKDKYPEIALFIGPEGGFSDKEIIRSHEKGIIPVTLGPRILRTETAALTVQSIIMYELGDIIG
ncbi:MAG TPA: 16S rRNA (uracil(1498)-N(3))-methyltransferase [Clostridiales bacterium]|nr:16S rRNA (uracil(1498)-N(3))-methyltransferase [Clostridiales bacterium]